MSRHTSGTPLLDLQDLHVSFGDKAVVKGVSLQIAAGEKLALVGESGSGKSITAMSLLKLVPQARVSGQAWFNGLSDQGQKGERRDLLQLSERELRGVRGRDIAVIFQEPMTALNPLFTIGDQIAEVIELHQALSKAKAWQRAIELLAQTGIPEPERRAQSFPHQLSGGQRQRAMIAMALACQPKLLLADEPTTALDVTLRGQVLDLLDGLQRTHGMAVLMITHDLHLVRRFADRVAVMEQGVLVECGPVADVFANPQHAYTRKLLDSQPVRDPQPLPPSDDAAPLMQGQGVWVRYPVPKPGIKGWFSRGHFDAVKAVDFTLPPGRTLGVIGESGSGKSTLAQAALGLQPSEGQLWVKGLTWQHHALKDRPLRRAVQVVFQDPFSSLSPRMTIEELVGEGLGIHRPDMTPAQRRQQVEQTLADVGLTQAQFPGLLSRYPHEFSGGQRQRVALARALVVEPQVLVLDEPTSALDVTIQKQVLALLQRLQRERGLSYLLITHDVDVVAAMAHELIVMKSGEVVERGTVEEVLKHPRHPYTQKLVSASLG
ncbi:ABC transporter ATP-binding protein [Aquabacterium parvum]|uniref:ABC transporter ATP-binding protein n=1 Tax=Aquabacterium parvum TaxID=70584 RepID=UPI000718FBE6|nr:dipeptide ABC transporter ATP-binding protein [Aquabacterium parvum]MBU0917723.1 dipeptide ABC transporter ATP-binding protein [Gammaproteobacteria bacterium]